jgi:hypothetical protein
MKEGRKKMLQQRGYDIFMMFETLWVYKVWDNYPNSK